MLICVALTSPACETEGRVPDGPANLLAPDKLALAPQLDRAYVSKRSNGVLDAIFADQLRGNLPTR
ncbi:hypothetical protein MesoLjLa_10980 [Mesorhizobium sp. L-2-11]|nr:hypothetical protein MesoLjLa_10980 [Mesorhizobium sp. L-2-11]